HILERLGFPFRHTHPQAQKRLEFVFEGGRGFFQGGEEGPVQTSFVRMLGPLFQAVLRALESPEDPESLAYHDPRAKQVAESIERLFAAHAVAPILDRSVFYAEATQVLELGYVHILQENLNAFAERAGAEIVDPATSPERRGRLIAEINLF